MDLRRAVSDFATEGRSLFNRLQSDEQATLTGVDLHILRVQLYRLDHQAADIQTLLYARSDEAVSDAQDSGTRQEGAQPKLKPSKSWTPDRS